jgi:hypothetical protein
MDSERRKWPLLGARTSSRRGCRLIAVSGTCSRCGGPIGDGDSLTVYDMDKRDFERLLVAGVNPLDDPLLPVLARTAGCARP